MALAEQSGWGALGTEDISVALVGHEMTWSSNFLEWTAEKTSTRRSDPGEIFEIIAEKTPEEKRQGLAAGLVGLQDRTLLVFINRLSSASLG